MAYTHLALQIAGVTNPKSILRARRASNRKSFVDKTYGINVRDNVRIYGPRHKSTAVAQTLLGRILVDRRQYAEATEVLQEAFRVRSETEPNYWETPKTRSILGAALAGLGRFEEAEPHLLDSYENIRDNRGTGHRRTREAVERVIFLYEQWGRPDKAVQWRARLAASKQSRDATDPDKQP